MEQLLWQVGGFRAVLGQFGGFLGFFGGYLFWGVDPKSRVFPYNSRLLSGLWEVLCSLWR